MRWTALSLVALSIVATAADAQPSPARISSNDNRVAAGSLRNNVLTVTLELRNGRWYPEADNGASVDIQAFAEAGKAPSNPGPLLRVPEGTELHVTLRNQLSLTARVLGLATRPMPSADPIVLAAGRDTTIRFIAGAPGTYFYWATTHDNGLGGRDGDESQLSGAFIIDPKSAGDRRPDRVFVMGMWFEPASTVNGVEKPGREVFVINGKSWPHTERFTFTVGDSVRWRWINPTVSTHPMHLHGFYYSVLSAGNMREDRIYPSGDGRLVNTELMSVGSTMSTMWVPEKPGNWVFHCHFAFHVSGENVLEPPAKPAASSDGHSHAAPHKMAGLVIGVHVNPRKGEALAQSAGKPRNLRLLIQSSPKRFGEKPAYGFVLHDGATEPKRDSVAMPGPTLLLRRGEPVRITIVNHLAQPSAIHWHGIELESFPDGVPNWSGMGSRLMAPIAPADSFVAEFTPPRSGTFMYHSHLNEGEQMNSGMYGPLIVVDDPEKYDPSVDKVVLAGGGGPSLTEVFDTHGFVNGSRLPAPIRMEVGKTYRLRLINIHPDWRVEFVLGSDTTIARWKSVAKDGADLPPSQSTWSPAYLLTGPGETADFEFTPKVAETLRLQVRTRSPGWIVPVNVIITAPRRSVTSLP
jgi:FtsP/CotA-like multicopper oxidase with cupredoxin domain